MIIKRGADLGPLLDEVTIVLPHDESVRRMAVEAITVDGLCMEFGVAGGGTAAEIIGYGVKELWGFDWFYGLPEDWKGHVDRRGDFTTHGVVPEVAGLRVVNGLFEDTIPVFKAERAGPVAFMHVDCDLYSSTATVFRAFEDWIVPGTVILFDELRGYEAWRLHEARALMEHVDRTSYEYEVLGRSGSDQRYAMRRVK